MKYLDTEGMLREKAEALQFHTIVKRIRYVTFIEIYNKNKKKLRRS